MSIETLKMKLKTKPGGVYFFCGENEYIKDHYISLLRSKIAKTGMTEFNHIKKDGKAYTISQLSEDIFALPFMNEYKLIEITNPDISKLDEKSVECFNALFADIPEYAIIVYFCRAYEYDAKAAVKSDTLADIITRNGVFVNFEAPDVNQVTAWIQRHFEAQGVKIQPAAVQQLMLMCGTDMYVLRGEIEKLCVTAENSTVTDESVTKYCCSNEAFQTFDLANALTEKNHKKAEKIFANLRESKTDPLMILGALSKSFADMLIVKCACDSGISARTVAADMKISDWVVSKRLGAVKNTSTDFLRLAVSECKKCDEKLKSFSSNQYLLIDTLLQRLTTVNG